MTRWLLTAACAALIAFPVAAAQDDPRLDTLFERLYAAGSEAEAQVLESLIWSIWHDAHDEEINRLMRQGARNMQVGNLGAAAGTFTMAIELAPGFAEAWNKRATVHYMAGRYADSIADCMEVLAREPRHFGALAGLGLIHEALGEPDEALAWFRRALEQNPHMPAIVRRVDVLTLELEGEAI